MPCPGPFHFCYSVDYIYDFCPLPDPDDGLSIMVCDVQQNGRYMIRCNRADIAVRVSYHEDIGPRASHA